LRGTLAGQWRQGGGHRADRAERLALNSGPLVPETGADRQNWEKTIRAASLPEVPSKRMQASWKKDVENEGIVAKSQQDGEVGG